jgi:hypothetical protein
MLIKRVIGWPYAYGGEEHSALLPPGAAKPPPTPIRHVMVDLKIEEVVPGESSSGYLRIQIAQDGAFCWDSWHSSIGDAEDAAAEIYGIPPDAWLNP